MDSSKIMKTKALTINLDLDRLKGKLELTKSTEAEIVKLLKAKAAIDELLDRLGDYIGSTMDDNKVKLIERERIMITREITGKLYVFDPVHPVSADFKKEVRYPIVDSDKVKLYKDEHGELPTGVIDSARKQKTEIKLIE